MLLITGFIGLFLVIFRQDLSSLGQHTRSDASSGERSQMYWGAYMDGSHYGSNYGTAPYDSNTWNKFEQNSGKQVSVVVFGIPWYHSSSWPNGYWPFPTTAVESVRQRGAIPMISWGSWDYSNGPHQADFSLKNIVNGANYLYKGQTFDTYVTKFAQDAKAWGHPMFLRFDWEMNGWWQFPWATAPDSTHVTINGNTPADYVAAWRHVHDIFTKSGATNVTWVWCPNITAKGSTPVNQLYPGDNYVDWSCLDGYNKYPNWWFSFAQVFGPSALSNNQDSYQDLINLAPNKPMMIGEWASNEAGDDGAKKAAWIKDALETQLVYNFPQIKAVLWFNWNSDAGSSYITESSSLAQSAFKEGIASPFYLGPNFKDLAFGPVPAPTSTLPLLSGINVVVVSPQPSVEPSPILTQFPTATPSALPKPSPAVKDTTHPTIIITSPKDGSVVGKSTSVPITTLPSDNVSVSKVVFYANGRLLCVVTTAPFNCTLQTDPHFSSYSITTNVYNSNKAQNSASIKITTK